MKTNFSNGEHKGFTLMELMVVVAIIAILSAVILVSINPARGKSRDAKRISDIEQIRLSLEQYFDKCDQYPHSLNTTESDGCPININLATFISTIPKDPLNSGSNIYSYGVDGSSSQPEDYILHVKLEYHISAIEDGLSSNIGGYNDIATGAAIVCDPSSPNGLDYCVGPK